MSLRKEELAQFSSVCHETYVYEHEGRAKHVFASINQGRGESQTLVIQSSTFRNGLTLFTLASVCIFSILFSINFLRC